jgi:ADP-heptose:LPS heptosyltransferase
VANPKSKTQDVKEVEVMRPAGPAHVGDPVGPPSPGGVRDEPGPSETQDKANLPDGGSVIVLRALPGLGDVLCAVPALRALKRSRPDVRLTVIAHPAAEPHWQRFDRYVDEVVVFPGWPGLPDRRPAIPRIPGFLADMQERRFDLAVQLHGDGRIVNPIVSLFAATRSAGYYCPGEHCPDPRSWLTWRDGVSEVRRGLRLMAILGWPDDDESLEFPIERGTVVPDGIVRSVFPSIRRAEDRVPAAVIHPGASVPARRWPVDRFARVADGLASMGLRIILTGSANERNVTARLAAAMRYPAVDLAGRTSLDELAEILRRSSLLVCNDTGVSHLAAALRIPSVVVFTDSEVARWAPLDRQLHRPVWGPAEQALSQARRLVRRSSSDVAA